VRGFSVFNLVFLAGLLVSVRVMIDGVERRAVAGGAVVRTRWAMLAGALTLSGFVGSLLLRLAVSVPMTALSVAVSVMLGALSARYLIRKAIAMPVSDHEFDPRFSMQGTPAIVVQAIPASGDGMVRLADGRGGNEPVRARSLDGLPIDSGVEVGVDRIDDGVAFVEAWSAIEARL
jgi:hypothetical protein